MLPLSPYAGRALCVTGNEWDRCAAIQELLAPAEVAHLFRRATPAMVRRGWTSVNAVAQITRNLAYIPDPPTCDLWGSPAYTLGRRRQGGDCDDIAILGQSALMLDPGTRSWVMTGLVQTLRGWAGHAWVEGCDREGWFLLEHGHVQRGARPGSYFADLALSADGCARAA